MKLSFKRPILWILYPIILYYPYYFFVHKIAWKYLASQALSENKQDAVRETFIFFTYYPFTVLCLIIAFVVKLQFHTANKSLDGLKKLIRLPESISSAKWIKYTKKGRWGIQAVVTGKSLYEYAKDLPVSTDSFVAIPEWAKKHFPKECIAGIDIRRTEGLSRFDLRDGLIYVINDETAYIEVSTSK